MTAIPTITDDDCIPAAAFPASIDTNLFAAIGGDEHTPIGALLQAYSGVATCRTQAYAHEVAGLDVALRAIAKVIERADPDGTARRQYETAAMAAGEGAG